MRRTGDRVHCAGASATYGREALPRQRGQGIRENPTPCRAEPRPMRCLLMLRRRPVAAKGAAQLALCGSEPRRPGTQYVLCIPINKTSPLAGRGVDQIVAAQVNLVQFR